MPTRISTQRIARPASVEPHSGLALKPPMGWNSWDAFGVSVTEEEILENADFVSRKLKAHGWEYIVVDLCWYAPQATSQNYKLPGLEQLVDNYGRLIPDPVKFPSSANGAGFVVLGEQLHAMGLKFGLHIMRGIPWQAAARKTPILGATTTADHIAQPDNGCPWYANMLGIDMTREGGQEYYDSILRLYADWGVDFIKADDMNSWDGDGLTSPYRTDEIAALRRAIDRCGRDMVLSLSPGAAQVCNADHLRRHANMWRVSYDFWDHWDALKAQFDRCSQWSRYITPGHWPDADMLPLGKVGIRGDHGAARQSNFTPDEQRTLMTLWCIFRSPLMFGGHLPESGELAMSLITNPEVLAVNQEARNPREIDAGPDWRIWTSEPASGHGSYVALFNLRDEPQTVEVRFTSLGLPAGCMVRDLWSRTDLGFVEASYSTQLPAHGCGLYWISP